MVDLIGWFVDRVVGLSDLQRNRCRSLSEKPRCTLPHDEGRDARTSKRVKGN